MTAYMGFYNTALPGGPLELTISALGILSSGLMMGLRRRGGLSALNSSCGSEDHVFTASPWWKKALEDVSKNRKVTFIELPLLIPVIVLFAQHKLNLSEKKEVAQLFMSKTLGSNKEQMRKNKPLRYQEPHIVPGNEAWNLTGVNLAACLEPTKSILSELLTAFPHAAEKPSASANNAGHDVGFSRHKWNLLVLEQSYDASYIYMFLPKPQPSASSQRGSTVTSHGISEAGRGRSESQNSSKRPSLSATGLTTDTLAWVARDFSIQTLLNRFLSKLMMPVGACFRVAGTDTIFLSRELKNKPPYDQACSQSVRRTLSAVKNDQQDQRQPQLIARKTGKKNPEATGLNLADEDDQPSGLAEGCLTVYQSLKDELYVDDCPTELDLINAFSEGFHGFVYLGGEHFGELTAPDQLLHVKSGNPVALLIPKETQYDP
ncbi:unnamed protein product [Dibothriocephalus latus]|uniref:Uncharacterized protein n=1 Tax=Dibothriocephalus latus TaxID=60516 RepID=A0A3P7NIV4_DIBLA|nr:unnamed protein product [Dibothriocephalus latus]